MVRFSCSIEGKEIETIPKITVLSKTIKTDKLPDVLENLSLVRLRLITHNARLVGARKELGMTGEDMAATAGLSRGHLRDIENLRAVPTEEEMVKIACVLEKPIDYLFPEELMSAIKVGVFSRRKVELAAPEVISLTEAQGFRLAYDGETALIEEVSRTLLVEEINEVLETLAPREQLVLRLRFGLGGKEPQTAEAVGRKLGVSRQRIYEIESKTLRKLRHPSRSRKLKDFLE